MVLTSHRKATHTESHPMPPNILAIDPSLTRPGFALGENRENLIVHSLPAGKRTGWDRIDAIINEAKQAAFQADLIVIETMMIAKQNGAAETAWLHGILRWELRALPIVEISGPTRQKWACGNQKDRSKEAVLLAAVRQGFAVENNDEADAAWLWDIANHAYSYSLAFVPQHQVECLAKIDWPEVGGNKPAYKINGTKKPRKVAAA